MHKWQDGHQEYWYRGEVIKALGDINSECCDFKYLNRLLSLFVSILESTPKLLKQSKSINLNLGQVFTDPHAKATLSGLRPDEVALA